MQRVKESVHINPSWIKSFLDDLLEDELYLIKR